jgi:hypothetical protein
VDLTDWSSAPISRCQCHRVLSAPEAPHWFPMRDQEPGAEVRIVAFAEDDPAVLQMVRVLGGWHGQGVAAPHPELTSPEPWVLVGVCWAGRQHPVVDVTSWKSHPSRAETRARIAVVAGGAARVEVAADDKRSHAREVASVGSDSGLVRPASPAAWMTCVRDGREHAVWESDFAAGVADGRYGAVCGHDVLPRALVSPCGARCPACVAALWPRAAAAASSESARQGGRGWVRGVFGAR